MEFGRTFDEEEAFDEIADQISLISRKTKDVDSGLFRHAWDESLAQTWADPQTGQAPHVWGRAVGWFAMALVDVLEQLPPNYARRDEIAAVWRELAECLVRMQHPEQGVWHQILDKPGSAGNYLEASASCMNVYALAKGVRLGLLNEDYADSAVRGFDGILREFVRESDGEVHLHQICQVAGLGGEPYRDGSFGYYLSEPIVANDYKGVGPFILAGIEVAALRSPSK